MAAEETSGKSAGSEETGESREGGATGGGASTIVCRQGWFERHGQVGGCGWHR